MKPTKAEIVAMYNELLSHAQTHKDGDGNGNAPEDCPMHAFNGVRTNVQYLLQCEAGAPPEPHPDDEGDDELHHMRQKVHFKNLWKEADALIAAAGVTAKGPVS